MIKYPLTFNSFDDEDAKAVYELFGTGYLTQGSITKQYEAKLCDEFGCNYAVAVNSGSSANLLMISALLYSNNSKYSLKPGDEIITVDFTFASTVEVIALLNLTPILVDVDPDTFVRWVYAKALAHRQPRYRAMANWGVTVSADEVAKVADTAEFELGLWFPEGLMDWEQTITSWVYE